LAANCGVLSIADSLYVGAQTTLTGAFMLGLRQTKETSVMNTSAIVNGVEKLAAATASAASSELSNLSADVEELLGKLATATGIDVTELRARMQDKISAAKSALAAGGRQVAESTRAAAAATDDYVRASPWQAIAIAVLAGVGVGYLLSRR
jgi:ElaB/YqjD/DUF883 family membrane-anchored ribosome-binding protein